MRVIDKVFDFLYDPFGNKKRQEDKELKELIERLNESGKRCTKYIMDGDHHSFYRELNRIKYL